MIAASTACRRPATCQRDGRKGYRSTRALARSGAQRRNVAARYRTRGSADVPKGMMMVEDLQRLVDEALEPSAGRSVIDLDGRVVDGQCEKESENISFYGGNPCALGPVLKITKPCVIKNGTLRGFGGVLAIPERPASIGPKIAAVHVTREGAGAVFDNVTIDYPMEACVEAGGDEGGPVAVYVEPGSVVTLHRTCIDGAQTAWHGVEAAGGAAAYMVLSRVTRTTGAAVLAHGTGSIVRLTDVAVDGNEAGVVAANGAEALIEGGALYANSTFGAQATGNGSAVDLIGAEVRHNGEAGVEACLGGQVVLRPCNKIERNGAKGREDHNVVAQMGGKVLQGSQVPPIKFDEPDEATLRAEAGDVPLWADLDPVSARRIAGRDRRRAAAHAHRLSEQTAAPQQAAAPQVAAGPGVVLDPHDPAAEGFGVSQQEVERVVAQAAGSSAAHGGSRRRNRAPPEIGEHDPGFSMDYEGWL
ncbi:unnamed protein product [Pedinophyceae sp. YPF-701]|nr:unnamed protein product [Pedinophyceae sp. YPF-701]